MAVYNFIRFVEEGKIEDDVHRMFTRYSVGEFDKEPIKVKITSKNASVKTGFEYLNFLHRYFADKLSGDVEISGTIESADKALNERVQELGVVFEDKKRFGKPGAKCVLKKQSVSVAIYKKIVEEFFTDFLLLNVFFTNGQLKVSKQSAPKLGGTTEDFVKMKLPKDMLEDFFKEFLYDVKGDFKQAAVSNTYLIDDIELDEKLLETDAKAAREQARRKGKVIRKIVVDEKEETREFSLNA